MEELIKEDPTNMLRFLEFQLLDNSKLRYIQKRGYFVGPRGSDALANQPFCAIRYYKTPEANKMDFFWQELEKRDIFWISSIS